MNYIFSICSSRSVSRYVRERSDIDTSFEGIPTKIIPTMFKYDIVNLKDQYCGAFLIAVAITLSAVHVLPSTEYRSQVTCAESRACSSALCVAQWSAERARRRSMKTRARSRIMKTVKFGVDTAESESSKFCQKVAR